MALNLSDITVFNSITNDLDDEKLDLVKAFSFIEYLNYSKTITEGINNFDDYENYLKKWNRVTEKNNVSFDEDVKKQYLVFLKDITLKFTTNEEKRYLSNIDFNSEEHLQIALPFYTRKIKQIILYYKNKRDTFSKEQRISKNKGSVNNIEEFVKTKIIDLFTGDDVPPDIASGVNVEDLQSTLTIQLEENYDTFNDYYDIDPSKEPEFYEAEKDRLTYFTSNTNYISANEFLDIDKAIIDVLNNKGITLTELGDFSPSVIFDEANDNLLDKFDYQDYQDTDRDNLKLLIHAELSKELLGTDFFYLSTDSQGNSLSGSLFESENKVFNILNTFNPTSLTIPSDSSTSERNVGFFFRPTNFSVLKMKGGYHKFLKENLEKDKVYIFPDPESYGNINGLSKTINENPFDFILNDNVYKNNSSSYGQRVPLKNNFDQSFYAYDSFEHKETEYLNLSSFDNTLNNFSNKGLIKNLDTDIYGNVFYTYVNDSFFTSGEVDIDITRYKNIFTGSNTLTTFIPKNSEKVSFKEKEKIIKDVFVKNISTNVFEPLTASFEVNFNKFKFNSQLFNELNTSIVDFSIFKNIFLVNTTNYSVIDSYLYNGNFISVNSNPLILSKIDSSEDISAISNFFIVDNKVNLVKISNAPDPLSSNNVFYYEILDYNIDTNYINFITSKTKNSLDFFRNNFNLSLDSKVKKIEKALLTYNKKLNLYNLAVQYLDLNENIYLHNLIYNIFNNELNIISNTLYSPNNYFNTSNFFTISSVAEDFSSTSLSGSITIDNTTGIITL